MSDNSMKVITVSNEKGGVGKTTVVVTIACGLAARGHRVLVIDSDPQGHATSVLGIPKYPGLYDLLVRDVEYQAVFKPIPTERYGGEGQSKLYLLGGNVETRNIANSISDAWALADKLDPLAEMFDYIVIDTAPTPSLLHSSIYLATSHIIHPTLPEYLSMDGLAESIERRKALQQIRTVNLAGIIPIRVRSNTLEHAENIENLQKRFGERVWTPIPESIVWTEAMTYQVPVQVYVPTHAATEYAWGMVDKVEEYCV